ncbi:hypothetical protein V1511DRAFT_520938 [Dipodascopsis uninucleata]
MDEEEMIANFTAITGADPERARQYLAVSDNVLDQAINFFLETGGAALDGGAQATTAMRESESEAMDDEDEDAAIAARLQREEDSRREPEVRERIQPRTETLVEDFGYYPQETTSNLRTVRPGIFNQSPGGIRVTNSQPLTDKQSRLEQLFRPPFDIMSTYDFETAQRKGREDKKWLLVNVQDLSDFQCQVLNRDFWSNDALKETVRANFIFMQFSKDTYEGQQFIQYYPIQKYPYIAILDPRTGEEMKSWPDVPSPEDWIVSVHEFLDRFSLDPKSRNPIGKVAKHKSFDHMTEEEQIKYALERSLGKQDEEEASEMSSVSYAGSDMSDSATLSGGLRDKGKRKIEVIDIDDDDNDDDMDITGTIDQESASSATATASSPSVTQFDRIEPVSRAEPAADPKTTTRVQIRLGDGTRFIRRFNLTDTVRMLFEYAKSDISALKGKRFQIISSDRKKLIEFLDQTIEETGLKNAVVLIEIDDDDEA